MSGNNGCPARGDAVEAWLERHRNAWTGGADAAWHAVDDLLEDYRRCADHGTPLAGERGEEGL